MEKLSNVDIVREAKNLGIIEKQGSKYVFGKAKLDTSFAKSAKVLEKDKKLKGEILEAIEIALRGEKVSIEVRTKDLAKQCAIPLSFTDDGIRAICFLGFDVSETLYNEEEHDAYLLFILNDRTWEVVIASKKPWVDCDKIARRYGGHGKENRASFTLTGQKINELVLRDGFL